MRHIKIKTKRNLLTAVTCDCQLLCDRLWVTGTQQSSLQAYLGVPLYWHVC